MYMYMYMLMLKRFKIYELSFKYLLEYSLKYKTDQQVRADWFVQRSFKEKVKVQRSQKCQVVTLHLHSCCNSLF